MKKDFNCRVKNCPIDKCLGEICPIKSKVDCLETENALLKKELAQLRAKLYGRKRKKQDKNKEEGENLSPKKREYEKDISDGIERRQRRMSDVSKS